MRNTRVLMIGNHSSVKGGITSVMSQLVNHKWEDIGIDMKCIPTYIEVGAVKKSVYFALAYLKIIVTMFTFNPDVLHIHMSYKGSFHRKYLIHKLCKSFRKKDIIHLHGSEFKKFFDEASEKTKCKIRRMLIECDSMIVLGEEWDKIIKSIEPRTNTIVVNNTVNIPGKLVNWDNNCFTILYLGVLIKRKGVADLLNAISLLKKEGVLDTRNCRLLITGSGSEEKNLIKQCSDLQIDPYVKFIGWVDGKNKRELLESSQLLILPSYNEGLPIAILEALSYGIPVISTRVGSINEAIIDGINGYLVNPGSVSEIAEKIELISSSKNRWSIFKQNSINIAKSKFDEKKYFEFLKNLYEFN